MIVPRTKLLYWFAFIVLPFSILGAIVPAAGGISVFLIAALAVLALADALRGRTSLAGVSVQLPEVVRMSKNRDAKIEVRVRNARQKAREIRMALDLPREIQSPEDEMHVSLPGGAEWSRFSWACQPLKRGNFPMQTCYLETDSPMGFWGVRRETPAPSLVRVYPNLLTERKNLAALFLNRGSLGIHAQRQVGKGRDFEKLREYIPGDGYDEVHWKATAKRGRPITKIFQIEKTQEVYVIIDSSRLTARTQVVMGQEQTVLERFVTAALVLGLAAEQQGDLFGLLTFSDRVGKFVWARNGSAHYNACRDAIHALQPQTVTPDFEELCAFIRLRLRRRALLVFLTALDDPLLSSSFVRNIELICRQHLVLVNMVQPPGIAPLFSRADAATDDDLFKHLGGHMLWQNLRELEKVLKRRGVRFSLLENEKLSAQLVSQYIGVKQRQLL
jgi:uncharacterized protein (DUF58 family)